MSPGACEFKIWQKMSGVLDEWKVLRALAENLYCDNPYYVCVLMNFMQYDQNYTTSLHLVLYYATVKEMAQRNGYNYFCLPILTGHDSQISGDGLMTAMTMLKLS